MAIGDIWKATASFIMPNSQVAQWVWHYQQNTGADPTTAAIIAGIVVRLAAAWASIESSVANDVQGQDVDLAKWDTVAKRFDTVDSANIIGLDGTSGDDAEPANVAPFVLFPTAVGRSKGKKFLFGVLDSRIENGAVTVGMLADMVLFAAALDNTITITGGTIVPGNFNLVAESFRPWLQTTIGAGLFTGSQYRRLPGRGV